MPNTEPNPPTDVSATPSHSASSGGKTEQESLLDSFMTAMRNAMELEIVTTVSDFEIKDFDNPKKSMQVNLTGEADGYFTAINLLTGDIRNAISTSTANSANKDLEAFHTKQVELAREVVASNLRVVGELAEKLRGWIREDSARSGGGTD